MKRGSVGWPESRRVVDQNASFEAVRNLEKSALLAQQHAPLHRSDQKSVRTSRAATDGKRLVDEGFGRGKPALHDRPHRSINGRVRHVPPLAKLLCPLRVRREVAVGSVDVATSHVAGDAQPVWEKR